MTINKSNEDLAEEIGEIIESIENCLVMANNKLLPDYLHVMAFKEKAKEWMNSLVFIYEDLTNENPWGETIDEYNDPLTREDYE